MAALFAEQVPRMSGSSWLLKSGVRITRQLQSLEEKGLCMDLEDADVEAVYTLVMTVRLLLAKGVPVEVVDGYVRVPMLEMEDGLRHLEWVALQRYVDRVGYPHLVQMEYNLTALPREERKWLRCDLQDVWSRWIMKVASTPLVSTRAWKHLSWALDAEDWAIFDLREERKMEMMNQDVETWLEGSELMRSGQLVNVQGQAEASQQPIDVVGDGVHARRVQPNRWFLFHSVGLSLVGVMM